MYFLFVMSACYVKLVRIDETVSVSLAREIFVSITSGTGIMHSSHCSCKLVE